MAERTATNRIDLKKSRIMSRPSTVLKLRRAADNPVNKAKRARGLAKHLRKTGSDSRPNPRYEAVANLALLETIRYDALDIQFVLENNIINANGFMSQFSDISFPASSLSEKIQYLSLNHEQKLVDTFYRYLESSGVVLDPIIPEMDIRYYEDTTTADIEVTSDPQGDKKKKKRQLLLNTIDDIMDEVQRMDLTAENLEWLSELLTMKEQVEQPYVEQDIVRVLYHLTESYKQMDIVTYGKNQIGHVVRSSRAGTILSDPDTGELFSVANNQIKFVIGNLLKEHNAIYESDLLDENSLNSFQAQLGQQIVNGIFDKDITDRSSLNDALKAFYVNRRDVQEFVLRYFVAINAHSRHVDRFLNIANKVDPALFPSDADTFALDAVESKPGLRDDKAVVIWLAKTTLKNANRKPTIMNRIFSTRTLLSLAAAAFVFGKESGLLWKYTEKYVPAIFSRATRLVRRVPGGEEALSKINLPDFVKDFTYAASKTALDASGFNPKDYVDLLANRAAEKAIAKAATMESSEIDLDKALFEVFDIVDYEQIFLENNFRRLQAEIDKQKAKITKRLAQGGRGSRKLSPSQMASREMDVEILKRLEVQRDIAALTSQYNKAPKTTRAEIKKNIDALRASEASFNKEIEYLAKVRALDKPGPKQRHISRDEVLVALGKSLGDVQIAAHDLGVSEPHLANLRKAYGIGLSRQGRKKSVDSIKRDASMLTQVDNSFDALHSFVKSFRLKKMAAAGALISSLTAKNGVEKYLKTHSVRDLLVSVFGAVVLVITATQVVEASPARFKKVIDQFKKAIKLATRDGKSAAVNQDLLRMMGVESAPPLDQQTILKLYNELHADALDLKAKLDKGE